MAGRAGLWMRGSAGDAWECDGCLALCMAVVNVHDMSFLLTAPLCKRRSL